MGVGGRRCKTEVLDVQREGEGARTYFGVREARHGFWRKTARDKGE